MGQEWLYLRQNAYKPYPHCRIMHGLFDVEVALLEENDIRLDEIDAIRAWGESFVLQPIWLNREIRDVRDAQFSMVHGLAVAAHRLPPGKALQEPELVFGDSVRQLMDKVSYEPHPGYDAAVAADPSARLSRIEIDARGKTFGRDSHYPKGVPSPDASSYMTNDELVAKFLHNVEGVLADKDAEAVVESVLHLDRVDDISELLAHLATGPVAAGM
jgi:2-methylcitrate dehydratase PrpD